jgi:uncharacterized membrane protein
MMWGYGFDWPSMAFMMFGSTLWIVFIVVIIWAVIRWLNHRTAGTMPPTHTLSGTSLTGMEILNQRYARGEIDAATFEQMRERLAPASTIQQHREEALRPVGEKLFD